MRSGASWWRTSMVGVTGLLLACGAPDDGRDTGAGPGIGSISQGPGGTADTMDSATGDTDGPTSGADATQGVTMGATTDDETKFDLGVMPDANLDMEEGCTKVDFLFIIDNSSSMGAHQANLLANFPAFINGIQGVLDDTDSYQVGVVTTDPYTFNVAGCQQLSSLVVQTGGFNSSNMVCGPYADGYNFMTENDDLAMEFACAGQVGTGGSGNEMPMQAMVDAVQRVEGGAGECNEGFLRDDSLLVIVVIGDEFDNSPGTPMSWYDDVVAARSGIPENVVVVSIIDYPGNPCGFGQSVDRMTFTQLWGDNGFLVPICLPDYGTPFMEAIDIIDVACENYIPPAG